MIEGGRSHYAYDILFRNFLPKLSGEPWKGALSSSVGSNGLAYINEDIALRNPFQYRSSCIIKVEIMCAPFQI